MSLTQFTMVEELAFLIKDNLPSKHLVLSMEEALIDFLKEDTSFDGVLELEPTNPYNRLLLHRLADIFGFSHQSVGEGDDRHLVLKRCLETAVPSVLVADLLWEHEEYQSPTTLYQISRRQEASPGLQVKKSTARVSIEEREAAYLAARDRIFSATEGSAEEIEKYKPKNNPVVARRMIAQALGQRVVRNGELSDEIKIESVHGGAANSSPKDFLRDKTPTTKNENSCSPRRESERKVPPKAVSDTTTKVRKESLREEHIGAAKRLFANALGFQPRKDTVRKDCQKKPNI